MKDEIKIPEQVPDNEEKDLRRAEGLKAAELRREKYSLIRDKQAIDNNEAIAKRLAREKKSPVKITSCLKFTPPVNLSF